MAFTLVVNPVSGRGRGPHIARHMARRLAALGCEVRIVETVPDSTEMRKRLAPIRAEERVVCIGGDGTLLHFINHALQFKDVAFFGVGTANVVTIEFGLPRRLDAFVAMLEKGHTQTIRPGVLDDGTRFLMMTSFGLDGYMLRHTSQRLKNRLGKIAFLFAGLRAFWAYDFPKIRLGLDGEQEIEGMFASVSRFRYYGGPYLLAPEADPASDHFQVVVIPKGGRWRMLRLMLRLWRGQPLRASDAVMRHARRVVPIGGKIACQMDGDLYPRLPKSLEVDRHSFDLVVPLP